MGSNPGTHPILSAQHELGLNPQQFMLQCLRGKGWKCATIFCLGQRPPLQLSAISIIRFGFLFTSSNTSSPRSHVHPFPDSPHDRMLLYTISRTQRL